MKFIQKLSKQHRTLRPYRHLHTVFRLTRSQTECRRTFHVLSFCAPALLARNTWRKPKPPYPTGPWIDKSQRRANGGPRRIRTLVLRRLGTTTLRRVNGFPPEESLSLLG